jgi:hypothetical protein
LFIATLYEGFRNVVCDSLRAVKSRERADPAASERFGPAGRDARRHVGSYAAAFA